MNLRQKRISYIDLRCMDAFISTSPPFFVCFSRNRGNRVDSMPVLSYSSWLL